MHSVIVCIPKITSIIGNQYFKTTVNCMQYSCISLLLCAFPSNSKKNMTYNKIIFYCYTRN